VFPFSFDAEGIPWRDVARWALAISIAGSFTGLVVKVAALGRAVANPRAE
jgi:hypothetical protein